MSSFWARGYTFVHLPLPGASCDLVLWHFCELGDMALFLCTAGSGEFILPSSSHFLSHILTSLWIHSLCHTCERGVSPCLAVVSWDHSVWWKHQQHMSETQPTLHAQTLLQGCATALKGKQTSDGWHCRLAGFTELFVRSSLQRKHCGCGGFVDVQVNLYKMYSSLNCWCLSLGSLFLLSLGSPNLEFRVAATGHLSYVLDIHPCLLAW